MACFGHAQPPWLVGCQHGDTSIYMGSLHALCQVDILILPSLLVDGQSCKNLKNFSTCVRTVSVGTGKQVAASGPCVRVCVPARFALQFSWLIGVTKQCFMLIGLYSQYKLLLHIFMQHIPLVEIGLNIASESVSLCSILWQEMDCAPSRFTVQIEFDCQWTIACQVLHGVDCLRLCMLKFCAEGFLYVKGYSNFRNYTV